MTVVGLDGYRERWLAVVLEDGRFLSAHVFGSLADAVETVPEARVFAVDIPIGLPERGARLADAEARRFIGPRASSVFPAPIRLAVEAATYAEALNAARQLCGKGLSKQSYALRLKILEADTSARSEARVYEVHPEVSFRAMAGRPLRFPKRTWAGIVDRRELLVAAGIIVPADIGDAGRGPADDVLDAAAAAWSAQRIATGTAQRFPREPEWSAAERGYAIWY